MLGVVVSEVIVYGRLLDSAGWVCCRYLGNHGDVAAGRQKVSWDVDEGGMAAGAQPGLKPRGTFGYVPDRASMLDWRTGYGWLEPSAREVRKYLGTEVLGFVTVYPNPGPCQPAPASPPNIYNIIFVFSDFISSSCWT